MLKEESVYDESMFDRLAFGADGKGLCPSYVCGFAARDETPEEHPELQAVFDKMEG